MTTIIEVTIDAVNACDNFRFHCFRIGPIKKARIELRKSVRISMEIIIIIILMTESTHTVHRVFPLPWATTTAVFCANSRETYYRSSPACNVCALDFFFLF